MNNMEILKNIHESGKRYEITTKNAKKVGEGTFGEVRAAWDNQVGKQVALKKIRIASRDKCIPKAVFREMEALKQLSECLYICQLLDSYAEGSDVVLVLEYLPSDLAAVITKAKTHFERRVVKGFLKMILEGIDFCHSRGIIHRDIKPGNILLTAQGTVRLGDFGLARALPKDFAGSLSHQVATRWYRAPELLFASRRYNTAVDIWSIGVVTVELLLLSPLFPGNNDIDQLYRVFQIMGSPNLQSWPDVKELPDYEKVSFPDMSPLDPRLLLPHAHEDDLSYIWSHFLHLNPKRRSSASDALQTDYWHKLPVPATPSDGVLPAPAHHSLTSQTGKLSSNPDDIKRFAQNIFNE